MIDQISITLNREDIHKRLKQIFLKEHSEMMSECLMDIFKDRESELEIIFKASMGLIPDIKYNVGDDILVKAGHVSLYYADQEKSKTAGYIKDDFIKGKITYISKYSSSPYTVKYYYIHKDTGAEGSSNYDLQVSSIKGLVDIFPGDEEV